ncbi:unnamed protein product [Cylicostephanus goldi]|uniref:KH type-2 domain-containing protein n=1 Tax=Cylicostephanus goldi TaxID=71465 RepID=A0A3P6R1K8_CYLGO|nr:unnamed protein product [Cylicostephanus goldi]
MIMLQTAVILVAMLTVVTLIAVITDYTGSGNLLQKDCSRLMYGNASMRITSFDERLHIGRLGVASGALPLHDDAVTSQDEAWQEQFRKLLAKPTHKVSFAETKRLFINVRGWSNFDAVFFGECISGFSFHWFFFLHAEQFLVSSLTGEGIEPLREHLKKLSFERNWRMDEMAVTSRNPQQICVDSVRAALLDTTPSNVAYQLKPKISEWKVEGEVLQIVVEINCDKERIGRLLIGKGGRRIAEIGKRVNDHMHSLFARQLFVRIIIKHNGKVVEFLN